MMAMFLGANLALRFLMELCALVALGYWGFHTGRGPAAIAPGLGTPVLFAVVWGILVAPRARVQLPEPVRFVLGLAILLLAAVSLVAAGQALLGWTLGLVVVLNAALLSAWKQ